MSILGSFNLSQQHQLDLLRCLQMLLTLVLKQERDLSTSSLVFGTGFVAIEGEIYFGCVSGVLLLHNTVFSSSILFQYT